MKKKKLTMRDILKIVKGTIPIFIFGIYALSLTKLFEIMFEGIIIESLFWNLLLVPVVFMTIMYLSFELTNFTYEFPKIFKMIFKNENPN